MIEWKVLLAKALELSIMLGSAALKGDVSAVSLLLFAALFSIYLINKLTSAFMPLVKPLMLLLIIGNAIYMLSTSVASDIMVSGLTMRNALLASALFASALASLYFLLDDIVAGTAQIEKQSGKREEFDIAKLENEIKPSEMAKNKRIWSLLLYLLITEFGVFSSKTIAAPSEYSGLVVFATFVLLSFVFVFQFYEKPTEGFVYLIVAYIVGGIVSIALGVLWGNHTLMELLSLSYFKSDAAVALMSGVAVSLFMNR